MYSQANQAPLPPTRRVNSSDANAGDTRDLTAVFKTTCGAAFRCKKSSAGDVEKLYCHQCLNQHRHIMEGRPSTDQELTNRGIVDIKGTQANTEPCTVDLKCARRTDPISACHLQENNKLSDLSQTLDVTCATKVQSDRGETECRQWLKLSELPEHYQRDHRTLPSVASLSLAQIEEIREHSGAATFFWPIGQWRERLKDAVNGEKISFYSSDFYTTRGYKLCLRFYPNGDGIGKGESASLFLVVMKGENDDRLPWPFQQKVTFDVMGEGGQVLYRDSFRTDPDSSSFAKPVRTMNRACGMPHFFALHSAEKMLVNDHLFIRVTVNDLPAEPPEFGHPNFTCELCLWLAVTH